MQQFNLTLFKEKEQIQQQLQGKIYLDSLEVIGALNSESLYHFSKEMNILKRLKDISFNLSNIKSDSLFFLEELINETQSLTSLQRLSYTINKQEETLNLSRAFILLGKTINSLANLQSLSFEMEQHFQIQSEGMETFRSSLSNKDTLKHLKLTIFVLTHNEQSQLTHFFSTLPDALTELDLTILRYQEKGQKPQKSYPEMLLNFSRLTNLIILKLDIANPVPKQNIGLDGLRQSLKVLTCLAKIQIKIDKFNESAEFFADLFDSMFSLPQLKSCSVELSMINNATELIIGENIQGESQLKKLAIKLIESKNVNLTFGSQMKKLTHLIDLELYFKYIILRGNHWADFMNNCSLLKRFHIKFFECYQNEDFHAIFINNLKSLHQISELNIMNKQHLNEELIISMIESISKLEFLETLILNNSFYDLQIEHQDKYKNCFSQLLRLKTLEMNDYSPTTEQIRESIFNKSVILRQLPQLTKLNISQQTLTHSIQMNTLSQSFEFLTNLQFLRIEYYAYYSYTQYLFPKKEFTILLKSISKLYNLIDLKLLIDVNQFERDDYITHLSQIIPNYPRLYKFTIDAYFCKIPKQVIAIQRIKRKQKRLVSFESIYS